MQKNILLLSFVFVQLFSIAQSKTAYQIFTAKGKKVSYEKMIKTMASADIILFGELHNNPIAHWLQYELTNDLVQNNDLVLGAEMFESDNQAALNRYLQGEIDENALDSSARLWKNYKTDYAPLVNIAKQNKLPFIATNIPRKYASLVYKQGFEALNNLPEEEKQWIAPLPIAYDDSLACYKNILKMAHGHGGPNLPKAQAIKDATMAYFILQHFNSEKQFIHYHGAYHSQNYEGILWYLKQKNPDLNYKTMTTVLQEDPTKIEEQNKNTADFIIVVDQNMTTTY